MTRPAIRSVGVVVPVHDEAELLGACLDALLVAVEASQLPTDVVIVLDDCHDSSEAICADRGVRSVTTEVRNVGMTRAIGVASLLCGWESPATLWLAGTDADTVVPQDWITRQVELADQGADLVLGMVDIADQQLGHGPALRYEELYDAAGAIAALTHPHVHGANLGVRGDRYVRAGGYPPLANHEDRALVTALLAQADLVVIRSPDLRVRTSGRLDGRCAEGLSSYLRQLAASA